MNLRDMNWLVSCCADIVWSSTPSSVPGCLDVGLDEHEVEQCRAAGSAAKGGAADPPQTFFRASLCLTESVGRFRLVCVCVSVCLFMSRVCEWIYAPFP